jgi:hypothetical protein
MTKEQAQLRMTEAEEEANKCRADGFEPDF